jgi:hypothetical protein
MAKARSRLFVGAICLVTTACSAAGDGADTPVLVAAESMDLSRTGDRESVPVLNEASTLPATPTPNGEPAAGSSDPGAPTEAPVPLGLQKIDLLFIVDNAGSMRDKQDNLAASLPSFLRAVEGRSGVRDVQIMVVDTDADEGIDDEVAASNACEGVLGAGRRLSLEGQDCGIDGEQRFLTQGQSNLEETFSCMAQVGSDGDSRERVIDAMLLANGPLLNAVGGCNASFLREDAVLVVTLLSDEEDDNSDGEPEDWRRALLAAKGDRSNAVVVLGLLGDNNLEGGLPGGPCRGSDADGAPRLQRFVESFAFSSLGSACADDYASFFEEAAGLVERASKGLPPPTSG